MKKYLILILVIIGLSTIQEPIKAATPLFSTPVNESLKKQLDATGKWKTILFSDGTLQTTAGGGGVGGGSGESGSWTSASGLLYPKTITDKVGIGTTTPSTILHIVGSSTMGSGVAIGTTTNNTAMNIGGTVTAKDVRANFFVGDGSKLSGIADGVWTNSGGVIYPTTITNNIGIGTTTPTSRLSVVGTLTATAHQMPIYIDGLFVNVGTTTNSMPENYYMLQAEGTATTSFVETLVYGDILIGEQIASSTGTTFLLNCNNPGTSTFTDSSSNSFVFTANGNNVIGTTTPAKFGSGVGYFDGSDDYLSTGNSSLWDFGASNPFTIEFWVYSLGTIGYDGILSTNNHSTTGWLVGFDPSSQTVTLTSDYNNYTTHWISTASGSVTANMWHHLAFVRTGTTSTGLKVYLDGLLNNTATGNVTITTNGVGLTVGSLDTQGAENFKGYLDDIHIENYAKYTENFAQIISSTYTYVPDQSYKLSYVSPTLNNEIFTMQTQGTTSPQYCLTSFKGMSSTPALTPEGSPTVFVNGSITVRGRMIVGTTSVYSTNTTYVAQFNGAILASTYNILPCDTKHKSTLEGNPEAEALTILGQTKVHKYLWNDSMSLEQATSQARQDFEKEQMKNEYIVWKDVNLHNYDVNGTITTITKQKIKTDFEIYYNNLQKISFEDSPDRDMRIIAIKNQEKTDSRNNTANYGIMIDDGCPQEILDCNGLPDITKWIGLNTVAIKALLEKLESQQQEIDLLKVRIP